MTGIFFILFISIPFALATNPQVEMIVAVLNLQNCIHRECNNSVLCQICMKAPLPWFVAIFVKREESKCLPEEPKQKCLKPCFNSIMAIHQKH